MIKTVNKLLLASANRGKLVEIQAILHATLRDLSIQILLPSDLGIRLEVVEDGATYSENASTKALAYSRASGLVCLADDSGLEVEALGGQPGLHSARYAPWQGATDADRRRFLLQNLAGIPQPWKARFHCTVALGVPATPGFPEGRSLLSEGNCPGEVISEERGTNGFGYDPIFYLPELGLTMAELSLEQKNTLSHRARAVNAARPYLAQLFAR
jgi:XTP/dITP diphosphohydrolase